MPNLKNRLHTPGSRLTSVICTIPSATVTQALAASGIDSVIVDLEHGAVDYATAHAMIAATAGTNCAPLVRVAENDERLVKRVLDLGAEGIIFPLVGTAEEAERAVASMRYPPNGTRGFGPFLAQSRWNTTLMEYAGKMDDAVACCLTVETRKGVENIEEICKVPGIDLIIPAPFDLSTDMGLMGQFDHPEFKAAVARVEDAANAAGIPLGNAALNAEQAAAMYGRGYRLLASFDIVWLRAKAADMVSWTSA